MRFGRSVVAVALCTALPFLAATAASAKPAVTIALTQASVVTATDGTAHVVPLDANEPVTRGAVIRYTISAKDTGTDAARSLVLTGRVPAGTVFAPGSVHGPGGHVEYSLDEVTFSAHPMVARETPAGKVMEPADPALYVMVRWIKDAPLAAAAMTSFSYDVTVK